MFESCVIAFAMYSKVPMPKVDWNEKNMRYVMALFPLVGVLIGAGEYLLFYAARFLGLGTLLTAALLAGLPVFITGGIHLDGFMDTMDARSSWGDREKKLAILKDSHTGAFAILGCCMWFLLWAGVWSEIDRAAIVSAAFCFVYTRILSGLSVTVFPCAKNSGLAATFHNAAHKEAVRRIMLGELVVCVCLMIAASPLFGAVSAAAGAAVFGYYRWFSVRDFGGITGDLAGYFLVIGELAELLTIVLAAYLRMMF